MKYEPALDLPALRQAIRDSYGLPVTNLTFLPEGWVGCHFIADCATEAKYFVTLLTESRLARLQAERLDFTLTLTRHLYDQGRFHSLVPPIRTLKGQLRTDFQGQPLMLYEFVPGRNLAGIQPYSREILVAMGNMMARLHRCSTNLDLDIPYVEDFTVPFEADFYKGLAQLDRVDSRSRPGQQTLQELLQPHRDRLPGLLDRLKERGEAARTLDPPLVLVHTDPTSANIIRTPTGELFLVDWEGARLAPAEQDLVLLTENGFATILAEYVRVAGQPRLYPQLFAYYFYRRTLEDLTDLLDRILCENTANEQDQAYLKDLQSDFLDGLPYLEQSESQAAGWLASIAAA